MNLFTGKWTDQKGQTWDLDKLEPTHLQNIKKMLEQIISGVRHQPEDCNQSKWEIKASLILINKEIDRRAKDNTYKVLYGQKASKDVSVRVSQAYRFSPKVGESVADIIEILKSLPADAKFKDYSFGTFTFSN